MIHAVFVGWGLFCLVLGSALLAGLVGTGSGAASFWGVYNWVFGVYAIARHGAPAWRWARG